MYQQLHEGAHIHQETKLGHTVVRSRSGGGAGLDLGLYLKDRVQVGALSPPAAEPGPPCSQQPFVWVKMWVVCSLFICVMFEIFNLKQNSLFNKQSSLMFTAYVFSLSHGDGECFHGTRLD